MDAYMFSLCKKNRIQQQKLSSVSYALEGGET